MSESAWCGKGVGGTAFCRDDEWGMNYSSELPVKMPLIGMLMIHGCAAALARRSSRSTHVQLLSCCVVWLIDQ